MCRTAAAGPLTAAELPGSLALGSGLVISHNLHLPPSEPRRGSTGAHWAHPPHCGIWLGFYSGVCLLDFNWTKVMNKSGVHIKYPSIWHFLNDQIWPPWTPTLPWQWPDGVESWLNALARAWASSLSQHPGHQGQELAIIRYWVSYSRGKRLSSPTSMPKAREQELYWEGSVLRERESTSLTKWKIIL